MTERTMLQTDWEQINVLNKPSLQNSKPVNWNLGFELESWTYSEITEAYFSSSAGNKLSRSPQMISMFTE